MVEIIRDPHTNGPVEARQVSVGVVVELDADGSIWVRMDVVSTAFNTAPLIPFARLDSPMGTVRSFEGNELVHIRHFVLVEKPEGITAGSAYARAFAELEKAANQ